MKPFVSPGVLTRERMPDPILLAEPGLPKFTTYASCTFTQMPTFFSILSFFININ